MSEIAVISLGAGVQSTTLLLMACEGLIEPRPVEAIFADTGWEPQVVYDHLEWLKSVSDIPIVTVSAGDLRADALAGNPKAWIPLHVRNDDGTGQAILRRQCTTNYKLTPIKCRVREVLKAHGVKAADVLMGISRDEAHRMRPSKVKYMVNRYPLVEQMMTRHDCLLWLERHDYPRPPKSACIGCPYRSLGDWRAIKQGDPAEWADALAFDDAIRGLAKEGSSAFLFSRAVPLRDADLSTPEDRGQLALFDAECLGMCGV